MSRRGIGVVAVAVAALLLTACGDDVGDDETLGNRDDGAATDVEPGGADLTVEAHDIAFDRDAYGVVSGPVAVEYRQKGSLPHSLVIEDDDGRTLDGFELEVGDVDSDSGTVDLPAGEYVLYCDVPGHRAAGMEARLQVE